MESSAKSHASRSLGWIGDGVAPADSDLGSTNGRPETAHATALPKAGARIDDVTEMARRGTNIAMAVIGLILAAPFMLIIAILIRFTSRGPVLYTQKRVGHDRRNSHGRAARAVQDDDVLEFPGPRGRMTKENLRERDRGGRIFTIYKFRTMSVNADEDQVWASPDDERVTPVGKVLRKLHLDELPQLFNVLKGDMNVVGPRPEQPEIFERLARQVPQYRHRQLVRPGITGWAQVNHHYDRTLDDVRRKVELDLEYLQRRSAFEDLKIALQTVPAVLVGEEAQGW